MKGYRDKMAGFILHTLFPVFIQPFKILVYSHKQANRAPTAYRLKANDPNQGLSDKQNVCTPGS
jgi:hypothetical protein